MRTFSATLLNPFASLVACAIISHRLLDLEQDLEDELVSEFGDSGEDSDEDNSDEVHHRSMQFPTKNTNEWGGSSTYTLEYTWISC